jgi:hypothetical protein
MVLLYVAQVILESKIAVCSHTIEEETIEEETIEEETIEEETVKLKSKAAHNKKIKRHLFSLELRLITFFRLMLGYYLPRRHKFLKF